VYGIRSLNGVGNLVGPLAQSVLYLRHTMARGCAKTHFGENQLSLGLIGLSPLSTAHPLSFQPKSVRPFTRFYARFSLAMDRSPSFGSTGND
jgi:hypothetical protein